MTKKLKRTWKSDVFKRNADRYYESDDSEDEGSKRKEGRRKLEEMRRKVVRNIDPSKLGSSLLIPSETSSSGSSSSSFSSPNKNNLINPTIINFNPNIKITKTNLTNINILPKLKNWNTFQELLKAARKKNK
jgi:hypothetical protein